MMVYWLVNNTRLLVYDQYNLSYFEIDMLSNTSKRASMPVHANSARKQKTRVYLL